MPLLLVPLISLLLLVLLLQGRKFGLGPEPASSTAGAASDMGRKAIR